MKAFKIYATDRIGFENEVVYACNYNKAIQLFNNAIRKELFNAGDDVVDKDDFGQEIREFKKYNKDREIICRKCPVLIHRKNDDEKSKIANIVRWEKTSYEYNEYEILSNSIILEEIEILE